MSKKEAQRPLKEEDGQAQQQQQQAYPVQQSAAFAGGTLLAALPINLFCHFGLTGLFVSGLASYVAWRHGPEVYEQVQGMLSPAQRLLAPKENAPAPKEEPRASESNNKRSWFDRALGYFPEEPGTVDEEAAENEDGEATHPDTPEERDEQEASQQQPPEENHATSELIIPRAPSFGQMSHLLRRTDRLILCYTAAGPVYGTISDLLSMAVVGKPGRGKTTALMYYATMLLHAGAEIHVWDPHGSISELARIHPCFRYADALQDIPSSVALLQERLEERSRLWRSNKDGVFAPLLLLVDELPVIGDYEKYLKKKGIAEEYTPTFLIKRFVLEARKWNCYFIGSGQSTDAEILPTRITENLSSRIVFYSSDRRARMAGLEQEDVKKFLPVLKRAEPGVMVFDCSRFDKPVLGAIPAITVADIQAFFAQQQQQRPPQDAASSSPLAAATRLAAAELIGRNRQEEEEAVTTEMLLMLLKQAGINVETLRAQQAVQDRVDQQPQQQPSRVRPLPEQPVRPRVRPLPEQQAHLPWSYHARPGSSSLHPVPQH